MAKVVRFLKTFEIWRFYEKLDGFFRKKNRNNFDIPKCGKIVVECVRNSKTSKNVISTLITRFFSKSSEDFESGKK